MRVLSLQLPREKPELLGSFQTPELEGAPDSPTGPRGPRQGSPAHPAENSFTPDLEAEAPCALPTGDSPAPGSRWVSQARCRVSAPTVSPGLQGPEEGAQRARPCRKPGSRTPTVTARGPQATRITRVTGTAWRWLLRRPGYTGSGTAETRTSVSLRMWTLQMPTSSLQLALALPQKEPQPQVPGAPWITGGPGQPGEPSWALLQASGLN